MAAQPGIVLPLWCASYCFIGRPTPRGTGLQHLMIRKKLISSQQRRERPMAFGPVLDGSGGYHDILDLAWIPGFILPVECLRVRAREIRLLPLL